MTHALLALLIAAPARAAEPSKPDPLAWTSTQALTLPAVMDHLELIDREMKTLSARFTQTLAAADTGITQTSEGTVSFRKPESLRVDHLKPERQSVTVSKDEVWVHRPSQNQAIQGNLSDWKKADPLIENLLQLGGYRKMLDSYEVALDSAPEPALLLTPKSGDKTAFTLRLVLARSNLFPEVTELAAGNLSVRTRLSDVRVNPALPDSLFRFEPPKGTDVFRDFKPPRLSQ